MSFIDPKRLNIKEAIMQHSIRGALEVYEDGIEFFIYPKEKNIKSFLPVFPDWENAWDMPGYQVKGFIHSYKTANDLYGLLCYMKQFQTKGNPNLWVKINSKRWEMKGIPFFYLFKDNDEGWKFGMDLSGTKIARDPRSPPHMCMLNTTTRLKELKRFVEVASTFLNLYLMPLTIEGCLIGRNYRHLYHAMLGFQVSFAKAHAQLMKMKFPP